MNPILKISNLSIGYKTQKSEVIVAQNIDLSLGKGKLTALIGANGIGKSTLLKTILGFEKAFNGTVFLDGKNINEISSKERAQYLSVVLTEKLPPSNLSVFELVALGRQPYTNWIGKLSATDKEKTERAIELTQIESLADKKHFELSDGQLQKVMIARALAQDTEIIILDEPTTHLDLLHKISVFKLLQKLSQQAQKSIIFSTHDIDLAIDFCDEIIVMTPEKIQKDTPDNLIEKGVFDQLFSKEAVWFDQEKRKFVFL